LRQQVVKEKAQRDRRIRFLDTMRQARSLWTLQRYSDCIQLLSELQGEFPGEEEILRLLETAREEQAEQGRRQSLEKARSLLAAGRHEESIALLLEIQKQFPADNEIAILLDEVHADQASQRRLQGLGEARRLLAGRRCDECIILLTRLQQEFPGETEIVKLLEAAREAELSQRRQQHVAKARKLLVARRYEECNLVLADLRKRFPEDQEIADLISAVREEQSEQRKAHSLAEARNLVAASHYEEAIVLLARVQQEHPEDDEVARLIATVRSDQADQRKLQVLTSARSLLAQRRYKECIELVADLRKSFPHENEIKKLLDTAIRDQTEQQRQEKLAEARGFLAAGRLADAQALLDTLRTADPKNPSVQKLLALVQGEQEKQSGTAAAGVGGPQGTGGREKICGGDRAGGKAQEGLSQRRGSGSTRRVCPHPTKPGRTGITFGQGMRAGQIPSRGESFSRCRAIGPTGFEDFPGQQGPVAASATSRAAGSEVSNSQSH
jgi:predicted Zn-dependent protease